MTRYAVYVLAMLVLCGAGGAAQQRELREIIMEFGAAPTSWSEALDSAPVVARVKLLDKHYRTINDGLVTITQYTAEVLEYFKAGTAVSRTIQVYRWGGLRKEGRREIKTSVQGYPDFFVGEEHVLFLDWNSDVGAYSTKGPNYAYRLDRETGRVYTAGTSPFAVRQRGRTISSMLAHLR